MFPRQLFNIHIFPFRWGVQDIFPGHAVSVLIFSNNDSSATVYTSYAIVFGYSIFNQYWSGVPPQHFLSSESALFWLLLYILQYFVVKRVYSICVRGSVLCLQNINNDHLSFHCSGTSPTKWTLQDSALYPVWGAGFTTCVSTLISASLGWWLRRGNITHFIWSLRKDCRAACLALLWR